MTTKKDNPGIDVMDPNWMADESDWLEILGLSLDDQEEEDVKIDKEN